MTKSQTAYDQQHTTKKVRAFKKRQKELTDFAVENFGKKNIKDWEATKHGEMIIKLLGINTEYIK